MKRRPPSIQLSEQQQLIVAILLVLLVAVSMLYCLGSASTLVLQNLEDSAFPLEGNGLSPEEEATATSGPLVQPSLQATPSP